VTSLERVVASLAKLPGLGPKSAARIAYYLLRADPAFVRTIAADIVAVRERVRPCRCCGMYAETDTCAICADPSRDPSLVCVVEQSWDVETIEAITRAIDVGAAALVSGGIDDHDLKEFLGYDLGVAITGSEDKGITLIVTEGFGDIAMARRSWDMLASHEGREASVNGATQIRAGVMRPEVLVPLEDGAKGGGSGADREAGLLEIGRSVRIIRDPWFGMLGEVAGLPSEPTELGSGSKARVLEVSLEDGERVIVPRANVELIEE